MTHDEMIAVIAAHRDGKALQWRYLHTVGDKWHDFAKDGVSWNFNSAEYRIKPEPREWWVDVYPWGSAVFASEDEADRESAKYGRLIERIHVREVLP